MASLYRDYKRRLIFIIMAVLVVILIIVNAVTYSISKSVLEQQFGLAAQSVAVTVAFMIGEDLGGYRDFLEERDENSEYYQRMQAHFDDIKKTSNIRFIYTINRLDDTSIEFILDSDPVGSPEHIPPGETAEMAEDSRQVFVTKQPIILKPSPSEYGILLGGNAPIIDEDGEVLGVVDVRIDHHTVFSTVRQLFIVLSAVSILFLFLVFTLLARTTRFFLEPMLKDKLTNAYNKRYFESILNKNIRIALRTNQDLTLLMIDLDHFKKVNDTYGHPFGDIVLAKVAYLIRDCLRKDDIFIRYGGEEFVALLINVDSGIALMLAERIRKAVQAYEIFNDEKNMSINMTISIGVASLRQQNLSATELVSNADKAMYKAKETRNAVAVYDGK